VEPGLSSPLVYTKAAAARSPGTGHIGGTAGFFESVANFTKADFAPVDAADDLRSDGLGVVRSREQVHQISCSFPIGFLFKGDVEVRSLTEHIKDRPEREPSRSIGFKAEIDPKPIDACGLDCRRSFRHV